MLAGLTPKDAADRVCHDEQMTVWTGEVAGALNLAGFLRDDLDYDDGVQLNGVLAREIRAIVGHAFAHPELEAASGADMPIALTQEERALIEIAADLWNRFLDLPRQHPEELTEFRRVIHDVQRHIMARPIERTIHRDDTL